MLENCPICNNTPHVNNYINDGSFYHTDRAIISCDCGLSITVKTYTDKLFDTGDGFDVQRNQYIRTLNQATWKWNNMLEKKQKEKTPLNILLDAIDDINYHRLPYWIDDGPVIVVIEEHRLITMENALINYRNSLKN